MRSVVEALGRRSMQHPERVALLQGDRRVTFGELWSRVVATACYLSDNFGVQAGERVILAGPSTPAFSYGYFATHLLGAIAVPVNPDAPAVRRDELIRRTQPVLALGADTKTWADVPCRSLAIDELETLPARQRDISPPAPDAPADVIFTTGTTGRPKGVKLTHRNLASAVAHINAVIGTKDGDTEVVPIPLHHSFGLGRLRCVLTAGAAISLVQGFRLPGDIFTALDSHGATGLVGVPAGFAILLRFGERGLGPFADRLRYVEIGSAPMPLDHKQALMKLLPRTALFMHYGLTEASRSAFIEFHRDSAHLQTAGKPAPGVRIEIRDENGAPCRPGVHGALWVGGPHVSPGYWDDPELSAASFTDGRVRTGDVAHVDQAGFIHLHGRQDDMINVAGNKVSPEEVERVLEAHPAVSEAACVGIPDPRGIAGQVVRAFIVAAAGRQAAAAELSNWASQQLEPYKIPVEYEWVPMLPRTDSGKLIRAALRQQAMVRK